MNDLTRISPCGHHFIMSRYDKEKIIGSGTFGSVWLVKSKLSRHAYVLKEINMESLNEEEQKQAYTEASVLSKCKHKNVIRYKESAIVENKYLQIIMEYAEGGDLYTAILNQNGVPFSDHRILTWFIQICLALQYIHSRNILHRDLKTPNIFLTRGKIIKIGDFGIARMLQGPEELAQTAIGTPFYLSPEIFRRKPYNFKSDMWALGCVLFEMTALEHAFKAKDFFQLAHLVLRGERRELPENSSPLIELLVSSLLQCDPEGRPSTDDILKYPQLQPYLSEYMANQSPRENFLPLLTGNFDKGARRNSFDAFRVAALNLTKRRNSITAGSSPFSKRTNAQTKYLVKPRQSHNNGFIKRYKKSTNITVKEYEVSCKIKNETYSIRMEKKNPGISASCDTYVLPVDHDEGSQRLTKSDDSTSGANGYNYGPFEKIDVTGVCGRSLSTGSYCEETTKLTVDKRTTKSETYCDNLLNEGSYYEDATRDTEGNLFVDNESSNYELNTRGYYIDTKASRKKSNAKNAEDVSVQEKESPIKDKTNYDSVLNTISYFSYCSDESTLVEESSSFSDGSFNGTKEEKSPKIHPDFINNAFKAKGETFEGVSSDDVNVFPDSPKDCGKHSQACSSPDSPNHSHCSHAQCHQCMLDMLWKNRIRCRIGKAIDKDEYQRLKKRLLLVFKVNLFEKVRHSLLCDWNESESSTFKSKFKSIVKTLNYEQVQSLPLMMQLIQLDLLARNQRPK